MQEMILFFKAQRVGMGAVMGDLFDAPAQVAGHMQGGHYVAPYTSTRKHRQEKPVVTDTPIKAKPAKTARRYPQSPFQPDAAIYPDAPFSAKWLMTPIERHGAVVTIGHHAERSLKMPAAVAKGVRALVESTQSMLQIKGHPFDVEFDLSNSGNRTWGGLASRSLVQIKMTYLRNVIRAQRDYEKAPESKAAERDAIDAWHELAELIGHEMTHVRQYYSGAFSKVDENGNRRWHGRLGNEDGGKPYDKRAWKDRPWEQEAMAFQGPLGKRAIDDCVGQRILPASFSRLNTDARFADSARKNET